MVIFIMLQIQHAINATLPYNIVMSAVVDQIAPNV